MTLNKVLPDPVKRAIQKIQEIIKNFEEKSTLTPSLILSLSEKELQCLILPSLVISPSISFAAKGLVCSPGAAVGQVYHDNSSARSALCRGEKVILMKETLDGDDLCMFSRLEGILATNEDSSSHFVIAARAASKPFLTDIPTALQLAVRDGDFLSIDGFEGGIYLGKGLISDYQQPVELFNLLRCLQNFSHIQVCGNADTPSEAALAYKMGADHVWPRTEAMLQSAEDLRLFRKLIVADEPHYLNTLANQLKEVQKKYITDIYANMHGRGVVIRLLDPPLHEFLPESPELQKDLAQELGATYEEFNQRIQELREVNPMLGNRGVRLLISNPEIAKMQIRAILEAAVEMYSSGIGVQPDILIPMVTDPREIIEIKQIISNVHNEVIETTGFNLEYRVGSMIETPRAAFLAAEIAQLVDFISFGTNDLTAFVYAFSRGDVYKKFLASYLREGTFDIDPFYTLDRTVAFLVEKACQDARSVNPSIKIDLCGEQSSTFDTIAFCNRICINTVSCAPLRMPIAWLYCAQASIKSNS